MVEILIDPEQTEPAYRQIYWQLREQILARALLPGARLMPSRRLARELGVARVTILQAYRQLEAEGLIKTRVGDGTYVVELPETTPVRGEGSSDVDPATFALTPWGERAMALGASPRRYGEMHRPEIDFGFGRSFAQSFPYEVWRRLLDRYLSTDDALLSSYGSAAGFRPLRETLADYLTRERGVVCDAEQLVIVSGAQQALDVLARLLLQPGDEVVVETPGYRDAFDLFRLHGARLIGLPVDDQGLPVDDIPRDSAARVVFATPAHQFPHGGTMPFARRARLLAWAQANRALIIEDDYDGDLRYVDHSIASLQGMDTDGRVVYLGTFSKVLFPALRVGYLVLPVSLVEPFVRAKSLIDRGAPTLTQAAVADFMAEGHFERHLRQLRRVYGERRAVLDNALRTHLGEMVRFADVAAGLHVMVYFDPAVDEQRLIEEAAAEGVRIYPGSPFHLETAPRPSVLLGFSGLSNAQIEAGVERLARAVERA